jgi:cytochrome c peroxidase
MRKRISAVVVFLALSATFLSLLSSSPNPLPVKLASQFSDEITSLQTRWLNLMHTVERIEKLDAEQVQEIRDSIHQLRIGLKANDFWLRYVDPLAYKKLNAPLPVEWEVEVFEKFESPYRRDGAGLTLAEVYLDEEDVKKDQLLNLLRPGLSALNSFSSDSIITLLNSAENFYFSNRLFLLNLAAIYTTGFECPNQDRILPELASMLKANRTKYALFNAQFPDLRVSTSYMQRYEACIDFVDSQTDEYDKFDHYTFIREYVNPLFKLNAERIKSLNVKSGSLVDYSLNDDAEHIFSKSLFVAQARYGLFSNISDREVLKEIEETGRLLFSDPLLSGNGKRSCASCHKPDQFFTDTIRRTALAFNPDRSIERNAPSLLNVFHNHLLLADGKHYRMEDQLMGVICNPNEMGNTEEGLIRNIRSSKYYRQRFEKFSRFTPGYPKLSAQHIVSAIMVYLSDYSEFEAPFDRTMNGSAQMSEQVKNGFNVFMGKAQCATCHFVPQFNGVKPPYTGSEFEVIGVPADTAASALSIDEGRYTVHTADEMKNAFRTGTIRNAARTMPYMHNGVFKTLDQVLQFYNHGGGVGHGLSVPNQTLSSDSLHLSEIDLSNLKAFIVALNEDGFIQEPPKTLPKSNFKKYKNRVVGGSY